MTTSREQLLHSLRDAHAMETQAKTMLKRQAARLDEYPELKARIERHVEETRSQRQLVGECLEQLGESPSSLKDTGGKVMAMGQSLAGMVAEDEVLKGMIASYAFEHMEIASYRMLITMAESCGEQQVQRTCERILPQEEAMATWLEQNMQAVTQKFISRLDQSDVPAGVHASTRTRGTDADLRR